MQIDRNKLYLMPLIRGPLWDTVNRFKSVYASVESITLLYETDPDAISPLLPEPYKPGKEPTVSVLFNDCNGVDFMVGHGYRLGAISVAAQFDGEAGHLEGDYVLVMPETETLPIVTGREWNGIPKIFANISSIRMMDDGRLRCEASLWGHLVFGLEITPPFKEQNVLIRKAASTQSTRRPVFGYKYIASLDGPPDADYPTILWTDINIEQLWLAQGGKIEIGKPSIDDFGKYSPIIQVLQSLPMRKLKQAAHWRGSMVLRNDKSGRLR